MKNVTKDEINNIVKTKFSEEEFICLDKVSKLLVFPPDVIIRFAVKEYVLKNLHKFTESDKETICNMYDIEYIRRNRKLDDRDVEEVLRLQTTGV